MRHLFKKYFLLTSLVAGGIFHLAAQAPFITTWQTDNPGSSCNSCITIPTTGGGYNYEVDWDNDGVYDETGITGDVTHDFGTPGTYTIALRGDFPRIYFNFSSDTDKILSIDQWGTIEWQSFEYAFAGCVNLNFTGTDNPDLSSVSSLSHCFHQCTNFSGPIGGWNVSTINDMSWLFRNCSNFNEDIGTWNVSNVVNMANMLGGATSFNQDIGIWNVESVSDMEGLFGSSFNFPMSFNQDISSWDVGNVQSMRGMFFSCIALDQDLSSWNVGNVSDMGFMFCHCDAFDQDLLAWDVSNVTDMGSMFCGADLFNGDITNWEVSSVITMRSMFADAVSFNQNIGNWNLNSSTSTERMFRNATSFNQDLGLWSVANVQDIGDMFYDANSFDQDLSSWELHPNVDFTQDNGFFENSGLSCENYSNTLIGWANNPNTPSNRDLGPLTGMEYGTGQAEVARDFLRIDLGWTIDGDTQGSCSFSCTPANQNDFDALIALYNSTDGPNWTNNTGWVDGVVGMDCDYCSWYGIQCDGNDRVVCINLDGGVPCNSFNTGNGNDLAGIFPAEIGDVEFLEILNLTGNSINGSLPIGLGNLANLETLMLDQNDISGSIPSALMSLNTLSIFSIQSNQLSGTIPLNIGDLDNLTTLWLTNNSIAGSIPTSISNISGLERLSLRGNDMTGTLPAGLGDLANINSVLLDENNFSGCYPADYFNFCSSGVHHFDNPLLPWQGDFDQFCLTDGSQSAQVGAPCNDGNASNGTNDVIQEDCSCAAMMTCPTEYTITYPDVVCEGEVFSVEVDVLGPSVGLSIVVTDGTDNFAGENVSSFPVTIELGNPMLPPQGTYPLSAIVLDGSGICTSVTRSSASSGDITIQGGGFGFDVPVGPVCVGETFIVDMSANPAPAGNPPYSYSFSYDDGSGNVTNLTETTSAVSFSFTVDPLIAGEYSFIGFGVTDNSGCAYNGPFNVPILTVLSNGGYEVLTPLTSTCEGEAYDIEVTITDGNPPYTVELFENGISVGTQSSSSNSIIFEVGSSNLAGDYNYTASVTDDFGCTYTTITLADPHTILPSPTANSTTIQACQQGSEEVVIDLTFYDQNINATESIQWFFDAAATQPIGSPSTFSTSTSITIYARAETVEGCQSDIVAIPIDLTGGPTPTFTINGGSNPTICSDSEAELEVTEAFSSYQWSTGSNSAIIFVGPGTYTVTVTQGDCEGEATVELSAGGVSDISCTTSGNSIEVNVTDAELPFEISWEGAQSGSDIGLTEPDYTITGLLSGTYEITVTDALGCTATCTSTVANSSCTHPDVVGLLALYTATNGEDWDNNTGWAEAEAGDNCDPCDAANGGAQPWFGLSCDVLDERVIGIELIDNDLTGSMTLLQGLDSLERIVLSDNDISGGNWNFNNQKLKVIAVGGNNHLKTLLPDFNLPLLEEIYTYGDSLMGPLPAWDNVPKLRDAYIYDNPYNDTIPNWQLDSLRNLSLYNCGLTGVLPELEASTKLFSFYADFNELEGPVLEYADKTELDTLVLASNNLSGCVPENWHCDIGWFNVINNPLLPFEGNSTQLCDAGVDQIGAPCDDGNAETVNDSIGVDCVCVGEGSGMRPFVTTWNTNEEGSSCPSCITIPTFFWLDYDYEVDWDSDGVYDDQGVDGDITHDFGVAGIYTIAIRGEFGGVFFGNGDDEKKLLSVDQWGDIAYQQLRFEGCCNFNIEASDVPDLSAVTSMFMMFKDCSTLEADLNSWDVSAIENMQFLFLDASRFNSNLDNWDVTGVQEMGSIFSGASSFNGNISSWDVGGVKSMAFAFAEGSAFDQDISSWDVSSVTNMSRMFRNADSFSGDISTWQTSSLENMDGMFRDFETFNSDISQWDVSKVNSMWGVFLNAREFSQDISGWNTENVTTMSTMFSGATNFNANLSSWNTSSVVSISDMFYRATSFNQDVSSWSTSLVNDFSGAFNGASSFDFDLADWELAAASSITDFGRGIFDNSGLSCENYSATLAGWAQNENTPDSLEMQALGMEYNDIGQAARDTLEAKGWDITGDDYDPDCGLTIPCPPLQCIQDTLEINILAETGYPLTINELVESATENPQCYSFYPVELVDTLLLTCAEYACTMQPVTVYSLDSGDSCSTMLVVKDPIGLCGEPSSGVVQLSMTDVAYTGQSIIEIDVLVSNFRDIGDYSIDINYDNNIFEYDTATNLNADLQVRVRDGILGPPNYINIIPQDGLAPKLYSAPDGTRLATLSFTVLGDICGEELITFATGIGVTILPCSNSLTSLAVETIPGVISGSALEPELSAATVSVCAGQLAELELVNAAEYSTILWQDGQSTSSVTVTTAETGQYSLQLVDLAGCSVDTFITINVEDVLTVDILGTDLCDGSTSTLSLTEEYETYIWSVADSIGSTLTVDEAGSYSVTVTNSEGCEGFGTVDITVQFPPAATVIAAGEACSDAAVGNSVVNLSTLISTTASGSWTDQNGQLLLNTEVDFDQESVGLYSYSFTTNTAVAPCSDTTVTVSVQVIECDECSTGNCLYDSPPVFELTAAVQDVVVSCIDDIPAVQNLAYSNGLSGACLIQGSAEALREEANFDGCQGSIVDTWSYTSICDSTIVYSRLITVLQEGQLSFIDLPVQTASTNCIEVSLYEISLEYTNDVEGSCEVMGEIAPILIEDFDYCGGEAILTWTVNESCYDELQFSQVLTIVPNDLFVLVDTPRTNITVSCDELPYTPQELILQNDQNGGCTYTEILGVEVVEAVANCQGTILHRWTTVHPCTGEIIVVEQLVTVLDCDVPQLADDYIEVRASAIESIDLFDNDIVYAENEVLLSDFADENFVSYVFDPSGTFTFVIEDSFFDTIRIEYTACDTTALCMICDTATIKIVDEALKDIILTDVITPDGDGQNDALRFNFEDQIDDSELWIFNRWGDTVYHSDVYTNDWDASGYPGGIYFYVLRIGDAEVRKTLTIVK